MANGSLNRHLLKMASKGNIDPERIGNTDSTRTIRVKDGVDASIKEDKEERTIRR